MNVLPVTRLVKINRNVRCYQRRFAMEDLGPDLRPIATLTMAEVERFLGRDSNEHCYANPEWTLIAPASTPEVYFLKQAEDALVKWKVRLRQTLGPGPLRRTLKDMEHGEKQLVAGGFLLLHGNPAHLKRLNWRAPSNKLRVESA